jgi:hypothetical protein
MQTESVSGRHPGLAWFVEFVSSARSSPRPGDVAQADSPTKPSTPGGEHTTPVPEILDLLERFAWRVTRQLASIEEHCERLQEQLAQPSGPPPAEPPSGPPACGHPSGLTADELAGLGSRGLFILGCARSGTSILCKCLNRSREVFMLEEASFYLSEHITDFTEHFNRMHREMGNYRYKGTYMPPAALAEAGPLATLARLSRDYRFVGEKVAIGPHDYPTDWARRFLDFQSRYFHASKYLLILRTPAESIWSMHKMFPDRPLARLFEVWLRTVDLSIEVYRNFHDVRMLFFERLSAQAIERLAEFLGVALTVPAEMFSDLYVRSHLNDGELPEPLSQQADACGECMAIYRELRDHTSAETHVYAAPDNELEFFNGLQRRIAHTLERLTVGQVSSPP